MLPSLPLYRCLPEKCCAPMHMRKQHSVWSELSPPGSMALLEIGIPRRWHPLSVAEDSLPFLLTSMANKELLRAPKAPCAVHIYASLLRDTAMPSLNLPPPRAVLSGSPPNHGRACWEPLAHIQAGVSGQCESSPA